MLSSYIQFVEELTRKLVRLANDCSWSEKVSQGRIAKHDFSKINRSLFWRCPAFRGSWARKPCSPAKSWIEYLPLQRAEATRYLAPLKVVQFSRSIVSDSVQPHGLQHARLPFSYPSATLPALSAARCLKLLFPFVIKKKKKNLNKERG